jgi:hypothetical protein
MRVRVSHESARRLAIDSVDREWRCAVRLVQFLECAVNQAMQYEAAWAICNIASGSYALTLAVVNAGAVPPLVRMLQAPDDELSGQAMWALGNIIGESPLWRDMCLELGVLEMLLDAIVDMPAEILVRVPLWLLSNLCRGRPLPDAEKMCRAFPLLAALTRVDLPEILIDTCWGLAHLSGNTSDRIQRMIDTGVVPRVIEFTQSPHSSVCRAGAPLRRQLCERLGRRRRRAVHRRRRTRRHCDALLGSDTVQVAEERRVLGTLQRRVGY